MTRGARLKKEIKATIYIITDKHYYAFAQASTSLPNNRTNRGKVGRRKGCR